MNPKQMAALVAPLNDARNPQALTARRTIRERGDGTLLVVILAVDR